MAHALTTFLGMNLSERNRVVFLIPHTFREHSPTLCFSPGFRLGTLLPTFSLLSVTDMQAAPPHLWTAAAGAAPLWRLRIPPA